MFHLSLPSVLSVSVIYVSCLWEGPTSRFPEYPRVYVAPSRGTGTPPRWYMNSNQLWSVYKYRNLTDFVSFKNGFNAVLLHYLHVTFKRGFMSVTRMMKWAFKQYRFVVVLQPMVSRQCWPPWGGSRASMEVSWPQGQGRAHAYSHGKGNTHI